jgi:hypothetical protein
MLVFVFVFACAEFVGFSPYLAVCNRCQQPRLAYDVSGRAAGLRGAHGSAAAAAPARHARRRAESDQRIGV